MAEDHIAIGFESGLVEICEAIRSHIPTFRISQQFSNEVKNVHIKFLWF